MLSAIALRSPRNCMTTALCGLALLASCGRPDKATTAVKEAPILNGDFDTTRKAVAQLNTTSGGCSGTFITPQLFLTAAHCFPTCATGGPFAACHEHLGSGKFRGHEGPTTATITVVARFNNCSAAEMASDPDCQRDVYQADYVFFPQDPSTQTDAAILHVTTPFTGKVIPLMEPDKLPTASTIGDHIGDVITMVGFSDNGGADDARRRSATATIDKGGDRKFDAKPNTSPVQSVCPGDSGGPDLFTISDGSGFSEQIGGVTSEGGCGAWPNHAVRSAYVPRAFAKRAVAVDHSAYLGCYQDRAMRDLPELVGNSDHMTPMHCVNICKAHDYDYASVQYGRYCFCGWNYGKYGKAPDSACTTPCSGDSGKTCGGAWKNSVYAVSRGCYKDASNRDLPHIVAGEWGMTVPRCLGLCKDRNYSYAGLQYRYFCACGDSYGKHGESNKCVAPCGGDSSQSCGGSWANDVFRVKAP